MYEVVLTRRAQKDFKALEAPLQKRIIKKLKECSEDPLIYSRKLTNSALGTYRLRIGDYRVIFDLEENQMVILRIGHRKSIYMTLH